jgi:hypothetical protein
MNDRQYRRERIIEEAVAAGKFGEGRRQHYRNIYDADPAGAERLIALLASVPNVPLDLMDKVVKFPAPPMSRAEANIKPDLGKWSDGKYGYVGP